MSYFHGAAAAVLVTSRKDVVGMHKAFYKADVAIAITYGTIAARHLGLSSCWMGLAKMAFAADKRLGIRFEIPRNERIDGILAVGYSETEWIRIPPRGPVKAVWF